MNMKSKMGFPRSQATTLFRNGTPKTMFRYQQMPNRGAGMGAKLGVGLGTAGLMFLMYKANILSMQR